MNYQSVSDTEFWRINKAKGSVHTIEWTAKLGGFVRAKLDSLAKWDYYPCPCVRFAIDYGNQIIDNQKKQRVYTSDKYEVEYYGA